MDFNLLLLKSVLRALSPFLGTALWYSGLCIFYTLHLETAFLSMVMIFLSGPTIYLQRTAKIKSCLLS